MDQGRSWSKTRSTEAVISANGAPKTIHQWGKSFPGLLAGHKNNGKAPTADGEIAVRATPEPAEAPYPRVGGQVAKVPAGAADP
jgi:hypothetical protein